MGSGIIIYQSKYGATKKYVDWLQEKTGFEAVETKKARPDMISGKETVILCGGIYASGIAGISFLRKNRQALQGKKTAIFCVGASPYDGKAMEEIKAHNLKEDLKDIPVFYGRGAWNESAMTFPDRTMSRCCRSQWRRRIPLLMSPG